MIDQLSLISRRLSEFIAAHRAVLQLVFGIFAIGLGFWGWSLSNPPHNWSDMINNAFRTAQLLTLNFPNQFDGTIPWQLQVARLLVPLLAIFATLDVLISSITRPLRLAMLPGLRDHLVVFGDASLTEAALQSLSMRNHRIIVVSNQTNAARRATLESYGLTCVDADPRESATFKNLNLKEAKGVLVASPDDLENVTIAMRSAEAARERASDRPKLILGVLIDNEDLANELDIALDYVIRPHGARQVRLCPDREGLRLEMARFAPVYRKTDLSRGSHAIVFGLGGRWEQILTTLVISLQDSVDDIPTITLVLSNGEKDLFTAWAGSKPDLALVCRFVVLALPPMHLSPDDLKTIADWRASHGLTDLAIVLIDGAPGMALSFALRRASHPLGNLAMPVLARQSREDKIFANLQEAKLDVRELTHISIFGGLIRAATVERVLDRKSEELAMALHENYLADHASTPPNKNILSGPWDDQTEDVHEAYRIAASHAPVLFAAIGLRVVKNPAGKIVLSDADIERLAFLEHRRFIAERILRGWKSGPTRDIATRKHDRIRAFEDMPLENQLENQKAVRVIAQVLENNGWYLARPDLAALDPYAGGGEAAQVAVE